MALEFERIHSIRVPGRRLGDALRVGAHYITIGQDTYKRMGYPETVAFYLSKDGTAIQLEVPGDYEVRTKERRGSTSYFITSKKISRLVVHGTYIHTGDNVFIRR